MILKQVCQFTVATLLVSGAALRADTIPTDVPAETMQDKLYCVFENNRDAIVKVFAQKSLPAIGKDGEQINQLTLDVGSGFLIGKDGIVMTSAYITNSANKLWVEWRGILLDAKSVGLDPLTTVSVIKIEGDFKSKNAPVINMDSSSDLPRIATVLMALSYEMGLPPSPRIGLATAHNIEFGGNFLPTVYVRTSIPAPRGSTGGAVFDLNGKFAGMTIASLPEIGGSFILPAKAAAKIRDDILLCGEPVYSWFGLQAEDADGINSTKVVVKMVAENAPAKKAGFMVGDEILEINSKKITNNTQLRNITFFVRPGETAEFKIKRGKSVLKLEVLAERMASDIIRAAEKNISPAPNSNPQENKAGEKTGSPTPSKKEHPVKNG